MSSSCQNTNEPILGIIGGSGLCNFPELTIIGEVQSETKYGPPSDTIHICEYAGKTLAFLPRHGQKHSLPPHKVPYKANLAALKALGVHHVIGTCIVGSLNLSIAPGSFVVPDQFVNLTRGRDDYFEADGAFVHLPMAEPYCQQMRQLLLTAASGNGLNPILNGTVAVIQGPRFNTIAESRWQISNGWDLVNMTQYPEVYFARELGLCYAAIAAVTDYDVGLKTDLAMYPLQMKAVLEVFRDNVNKTKSLLLSFVETQFDRMTCHCASTLLKAYYEE